MSADVLIVGAGLSGCTLAYRLTQQNIRFDWIDARNRAGGRVLSAAPDNSGATVEALDLGPAWLWPHQHHLLKLIKELELDEYIFEQQHRGDSLIEYAGQQAVRAPGAISMAGSYRLDGGMATIIERLIAGIGESHLRKNTRLTALRKTPRGIETSLTTKNADSLQTYQFVVLALPPRLAATHINFSNFEIDVEAMRSVSTWMASEAKILLTYDTAFWQPEALSGDAFSQTGPLTEIHDASPRQAQYGTLFGFIGARPNDRLHREAQLKQQAIEQIGRMFKTDQRPVSVLYKDWATDPLTATEIDATSPRNHPDSTRLHQRHREAGIIWAGTETARSQNAGYLEGAVEAADAALMQIEQSN